MKKCNLALIMIVPLILPLGVHAKSGLTVSFKTGFPLNGTRVGLKLGPLVAYGGLDVARIAASFDRSHTSWDRQWAWNPDTQQYEYSDLYRDYESESTLKGSALLFVPRFGGKLYLNKLYLLGEVLWVIPSVNGRDKGKSTWYKPDGTISNIESWDEKLEKDEKETIEDAIDFWGVSLGFGVEYAFSRDFSISGEYGVNVLFNSITDEDSDIDEDDPPDWKDEWENKIRITLGVTYTRFSLNYYL